MKRNSPGVCVRVLSGSYGVGVFNKLTGSLTSDVPSVTHNCQYESSPDRSWTPSTLSLVYRELASLTTVRSDWNPCVGHESRQGGLEALTQGEASRRPRGDGAGRSLSGPGQTRFGITVFQLASLSRP